MLVVVAGEWGASERATLLHPHHPAPRPGSLLQEALRGVATALRHAAGDHTRAQRIQRVLAWLHALVVVHLHSTGQCGYLQ